MGSDKAWISFLDEPLLSRVVRRILPAAPGETIVVARAGQVLPPLPPGARVVRDAVADAGPLAGIATGLRACRAPAAFVTAGDAPFVSPRVAERLFERLGDADAAAVVREGRIEPLCAVYRTRVADVADRLLRAGRHRVSALAEAVTCVRVGPDELRDVDPGADSVVDCDTPGALEWAVRRARAGALRDDPSP